MYPPPGYSTSTILDNALPTTTTAVTKIAHSTATMLSTTSLNLHTQTATRLLSATATALAAAAATAAAAQTTSQKEHPHADEPENGECKLLGPFALIVQAALGGCALLALVYKRWRERPQRPLKIWSFDVSKQVVGSALVHVANLVMSMLSSGQFSIKVEPRRFDARGHYQPNPCSFYLLNLAIDTTAGIPILIILLRVITALFSMTNFGTPAESIQSGNYGSPPRASWWAKQSFIYFIGLMLMKVCVLIIFLVLPWISQVGDWALRWTEGNETLQVIFVMLFFPLIMNATQYYIIDSFIKKQETAATGIEGGITSDTDEHGTSSFEERISDEIDSDAEDEGKKAFLKKSQSTTRSVERRDRGRRKPSSLKDSRKIKSHEYDPELDGENSPTVGSGSNGDRGGRFVNRDGDDDAVGEDGK